MFASHAGISKQKPGFAMKTLRFSNFAPQLYNLCTDYAKMKHDTIMPARSFCSDGSQGYPTILMASHFGTFPFDYGQIGGVFDFNRSPAFAGHGKDLVIVQATHVGYDPATKKYGRYPRHRTGIQKEDVQYTANCGHVGGVMKPYQLGYQSASSHTMVKWCPENSRYLVSVRNFFLDEVFNKHSVNVDLDTHRMLKRSEGAVADVLKFDPVSRVFEASAEFAAHLDTFGERFKKPASPADGTDGFIPLADALTENWFGYKCREAPGSRYEENIRNVMPWVVTQEEPFLSAAQASVQAEFHRVLNDFYFSKDMFKNKNLFYISGVIVDVAPTLEQVTGDDAFFPRTLFAPWSAYINRYDADKKTEQKEIWDQAKVMEMLSKQPTTNSRQMKLDEAVKKLREFPDVELPPYKF